MVKCLYRTGRIPKVRQNYALVFCSYKEQDKPLNWKSNVVITPELLLISWNAIISRDWAGGLLHYIAILYLNSLLNGGVIYSKVKILIVTSVIPKRQYQ